jgi:excisionase family DNA binding protein
MTQAGDLVPLLERVLSRLDAVEQRLAPFGPKGLYDLDEAGAYLGISRSEIKRLIERRALRSVTIGRRRFVPQVALEEFIAERLVG